METKIMSGQQAFEAGAKLINAGEVVVFPTETVYGLGANAFDAEAVKKIFLAKGRPSDNPLIVHICDKSQIADIVAVVTEQAQKVIDAFMPGPITVILPKANSIPYSVTAGLETVGIRMPSHEDARKFIAECKTPIAAPSANKSMHISPTTAQDVFEDMQGIVPLIIDGGACQVGIESTIIDMSTDIPTVLRPGAITVEMLASVLDSVQTFKGEVVVAKAPGMKYKHYAPSCDMVVATSLEKCVEEFDLQKSAGKNPIIICKQEWLDKLAGRRSIVVGKNGEEVARNIYCAMHSGEKLSDLIICQDFGASGVYASVMNRVIKAAGGKKL
ncbi:MAG: L-threonylcarbamoyladenylate synthase [Clostridia bacterium]